MINRWRSDDHARIVAASADADLASCAYMTRLAGAEADLALHGGGNSSVKTTVATVCEDATPCLYVKGSGVDMGAAVESDFAALDLAHLRRLRSLPKLSDEAMADEFELHRLKICARRPSIEALMHAFLPSKYILHTHPAALLALGNRSGGLATTQKALGDKAQVIPYAHAGLDLAKAVADAYDTAPSSNAIAILHHGLTTWGDTAQEAYAATIAIVTCAEEFLEKCRCRIFVSAEADFVAEASRRYLCLAPAIRGALAPATGDPDKPYGRIVLRRIGHAAALGMLQTPFARDLALTPPLTPDHLIRTRAFPLWIDQPAFDEPGTLRNQIHRAVAAFQAEYRRRLEHAGLTHAAPPPAVALIPGLGVVCAGADSEQARIAADIAQQTLRVKALIHETGGNCQALEAGDLLEMEFRSCQRAKIAEAVGILHGTIALVTGAAGAIGSAICEALLAHGCHVAAADLADERLDALVNDLRLRFGDRIIAAPQDVTGEASVAAGFDAVVNAWGGIDLVVANAGIAHVSSLAAMRLEDFQRLERVNIDGTLLTIREAARRFELQNTGGDIVLISTKNVFAPGAKFSAYSATKAAAHQIARIASVELAEIGVRVNMVAPDAVFEHGGKKSGLWATVGPERMRARGMDEKELAEYYRGRNLLKAAVTAQHVAQGVLFFAARQTPTTGATIPIDGGLPDATPR